MSLLIVYSLALVASVLAQSSANLFAVNYPIVAYLLSSEANVATTYLVACPSDTPSTSCDFAQPYTLIEGPTTVSFEFTAPVTSLTQSFTLGCKLEGTTSLGCSATGLSGDSPSSPVTTSEAFDYTGQQAATFFKPIALVAHSTSLLTYTPGATSTSSAVTITETSTISASKSSQTITSPTITSPIIHQAAATASSTKTSAATEAVVPSGGFVMAMVAVLVMAIV